MVDFELVNVNFKNKKTCDCVIRALANASGKDYKVVAKELFDIWMATGYEMLEKRCYDKWLADNGFIKMKQPRRPDNTKYLVGEIDELVSGDDRVVISCANHLTCVIEDTLEDLWDCREKTIGNYYILKN